MAEDAANSDYLNMLKDTEQRQRYFSAIAQPDSSDHGEIAKVKAKINQLIQHEIELQGFKDKLSQEELSGLTAETYQEVATKSNFYFNYDQNKVNNNLKVYNFEAPGNKYRHPNVILPHEHVNI